MTTLPDNTTLIANSDVWIEGEALLQLSRIASLPQCFRAVGLPDIHPGPGIPIGAAFAFDGEIRPLLVGADAGCGVAVVAVHKIKARGDQLMRRLDAEFEQDPLPDVDRDALLDALWQKGPRGLIGLEDVPETLQDLVEGWGEEPAWLAEIDSGERPEGWTTRPGTIGGGNHFLEVSRVSQIQDREEAAAVGLKPGGFAVVAHSGSRGLGRALKGSAPADDGTFTIVLGSRGAESWVMVGQGAASCLCSVAHGAGRRMGRNEAIEKLRARHTRASLTHTALGGRVMCRDRDLLYAEHPDAYKAIEPVIASLEAAVAARRMAALTPLVTVKR